MPNSSMSGQPTVNLGKLSEWQRRGGLKILRSGSEGLADVKEKQLAS
jgi:hypothetical protein